MAMITAIISEVYGATAKSIVMLQKVMSIESKVSCGISTDEAKTTVASTLQIAFLRDLTL
jgi:hypothetical protein